MVTRKHYFLPCSRLTSDSRILPLLHPLQSQPRLPQRQPLPSLSNSVRLPKLHLRHFNGDLTKWTGFWESFEAAVDSNPDLSSVEKFNYLSSLLENTAREAIAGLSLTEANYAEAVSTLKKRFGGTQQIISKHMEALLQVEAVSSSQNVKALRRLFDNISSHMRSLASLKVREETYGSLLCPVLINKIPPDLQLIVCRKVPEADWELKTLMSAIEEEIVARERLGPSRPPRRPENKPPPTATTLVAKELSTVTPLCCYCNQQHRATDCMVVTQVDERKQLLRRAGRCFSCLRRGHLSRNCRTTSRCQQCHGKHHTSICSGSTNRGEPASGAAAVPPPATESTTSNLKPSAPEFTPTKHSSHASTLCVNVGKPILLQTASAVVFNPCDSTSSKLRIMMDSGSQRSYLTQRARDTLHLQTVARQRLAIAAFGSERAGPRLCEVIRVSVRTRAGEDKNIDLFVVPHICEAFTAQPIDKCLEHYPHILGLDLADNPLDETREIDSPLLSRLFPNRPTIAFRTYKNIRKQLTRARLEDSKIVYKIDRELNLLCEPLPAPNAPPLIKKCNNNCLTCKALDTKPYIRSTSKSTYHNLKIKNSISCKSRNVLYVITCTRCKVQYVGMTTQPLHNRFSTHMREMFSKRPPNWVQTRLYRHFQQKYHNPSDVRVQPVEYVEDRRNLKKRESAWIKALRTIEPRGLNIIP